jgi:hypothetical protein
LALAAEYVAESVPWMHAAGQRVTEARDGLVGTRCLGING